jgi:inner membrane protein
MDPLTHTATGLFLGRTGLNRVTPGATAILLLAANAPDIDIVCALGGSVDYLHYHRHLTHALIAAPLMALLPVALTRLAMRKPVRWLPAFAISLVAVLIHLLLDFTNVYGIRFFLPFSGEWLRLDCTSVVDLWIWAICLVAVAAPFISKLVGSEIASRKLKPKHYGRGWAIAALLLIALYDCGRLALNARATGMLESRIYRQEPPLRAIALPDPANPLHWRGVVETAGFYAVQDLNLLRDFDPTRAAYYRKPPADLAIQAASQTKTIREFLRFSVFPLWRVTPAGEPDGSRLVEVFDMRFGTPDEPGFVASAVVGPDGRVASTHFTYGKARPH